jgi:hypothetical protein
MCVLCLGWGVMLCGGGQLNCVLFAAGCVFGGVNVCCVCVG